MCVTIKLSGDTREKLALALCTVNVLLALSGGGIIGLAIYLKNHLEDKLSLLEEEYESDILPHFLISIGTLIAILHGIGAKITYDSSESDFDEQYHQIWFPFLVLLFILSWVTFAGGIMCFVHKNEVEDALHAGIKTAMKRYKNELLMKITIDKLQIKTKCCGSRSYKDWFNVGWINTDFVDLNSQEIKEKLRAGNVYTDDVPFSCCNPAVRRPCVHNSVTDAKQHLKYSNVTLHRVGCTTALMAYTNKHLLHPAASLAMCIWAAQVLTILLLRLLQTSLATANSLGGPDATGVAYLFCAPDNMEEQRNTATKSRRLKRSRSDSDADSRGSVEAADDLTGVAEIAKGAGDKSSGSGSEEGGGGKGEKGGKEKGDKNKNKKSKKEKSKKSEKKKKSKGGKKDKKQGKKESGKSKNKSNKASQKSPKGTSPKGTSPKGMSSKGTSPKGTKGFKSAGGGKAGRGGGGGGVGKSGRRK